MLIYRTYACDGANEAPEPHSFEILIERDQHPRFCPLCGAQFSEAPETVPSRIAIGGSAAARSVESTYRLVEESSAARAQMAEEAGLPAAQARSIKVTDMHDNMREGDVAAKIPARMQNPVGQFMRDASAVGINYGWQQGSAPGSGQYNGPTTSMAGARATGPANIALGEIQGQSGHNHEQTRAKVARQNELLAVVGDKRVR